jgi:hypothetical protein
MKYLVSCEMCTGAKLLFFKIWGEYNSINNWKVYKNNGSKTPFNEAVEKAKNDT